VVTKKADANQSRIKVHVAISRMSCHKWSATASACMLMIWRSTAKVLFFYSTCSRFLVGELDHDKRTTGKGEHAVLSRE
jgi:hypothetical protein